MNNLLIVVYLVFAQTAVLLVKLGGQGASFTVNAGMFSVTLNIKMIIGLCLYIFSFILWIVLISQNNLSYITPIITGANYIIPMGIGVILLHEKMFTHQYIGAVIILIGLIVINFRGNATL